jgi:hypothetical protein
MTSPLLGATVAECAAILDAKGSQNRESATNRQVHRTQGTCNAPIGSEEFVDG